MTMKMMRFFCTACLLVFVVVSGALALDNYAGASSYPENPGDARGPVAALDEVCIIDFIGFTQGTHEGNMTWPGGSGQYTMSEMMFLNSCTPGDTLYAYCTDLNHSLYSDPYCVSIDSMVVQPDYLLQVPALAYIMTWLQPASEAEDRIKQLAIWKLSNDHRENQPTYGTPYIYMNAGRGYPNIGDTPVFPYVNTVYNNDADMNNPANALVLNGVGYGPDGQRKNVALCDDQLLIATEDAVVEDGVATVAVTVTLERGPRAVELGNAALSGVKLLISSDNGILSKTEEFTDGNGQVQFTISQQVAEHYDANLRICTYSVWPRVITSCSGAGYQQLLIQQLTDGERCELCSELTVDGDQFLPVELSSFNAVALDRQIVLNWSTASETNTARFEILRDGALVCRKDAANSATGADYSWLDASVVNGVEYTYTLISVDIDGSSSELAEVSAIPVFSSATVTEFALHQNYPNPFNPKTNIVFDLTESSNVVLTVYNPLGQAVATLMNEPVAAGRHTIVFDAANLTSGLYYYRIEAGEFSAVRKMILMK